MTTIDRGPARSGLRVSQPYWATQRLNARRSSPKRSVDLAPKRMECAIAKRRKSGSRSVYATAAYTLEAGALLSYCCPTAPGRRREASSCCCRSSQEGPNRLHQKRRLPRNCPRPRYRQRRADAEPSRPCRDCGLKSCPPPYPAGWPAWGSLVPACGQRSHPPGPEAAQQGYQRLARVQRG